LRCRRCEIGREDFKARYQGFDFRVDGRELPLLGGISSGGTDFVLRNRKHRAFRLLDNLKTRPEACYARKDDEGNRVDAVGAPLRHASIFAPSRATATTPRRALLKMVPSPMEMSRTRVRVAETPHKRNPVNRRSEDSMREVGVLDMAFPSMDAGDIHRYSEGLLASAESASAWT